MVHTVVALSVLYMQQLAPQKPTTQGSKHSGSTFTSPAYAGLENVHVAHSMRSTVLRRYCACDPYLIASALHECRHTMHMHVM